MLFWPLESRKPRGRPRDPRVDRAILETAQRLLATGEYLWMSVDDIAVTSLKTSPIPACGVSKTVQTFPFQCSVNERRNPLGCVEYPTAQTSSGATATVDSSTFEKGPTFGLLTSCHARDDPPGDVAARAIAGVNRLATRPHATTRIPARHLWVRRTRRPLRTVVLGERQVVQRLVDTDAPHVVR